jgi:hypothetical protein
LFLLLVDHSVGLFGIAVDGCRQSCAWMTAKRLEASTRQLATEQKPLGNRQFVNVVTSGVLVMTWSAWLDLVFSLDKKMLIGSAEMVRDVEWVRHCGLF